jgi:hypothetical protein
MSGIFKVTERASGSKGWSVAHSSSSNDDDHSSDVTSIAVATLDEPIVVPSGPPHRPWLVPGIQGAV